jgi:ATP-dependent DNA helicase RecG
MKDFVGLFEGKLSIKQVRIRIEKLVKNEIIQQQGTTYKVNDVYLKKMEVYAEAITKTIFDLDKNERAKKGQKKDQ